MSLYQRFDFAEKMETFSYGLAIGALPGCFDSNPRLSAGLIVSGIMVGLYARIVRQKDKELHENMQRDVRRITEGIETDSIERRL